MSRSREGEGYHFLSKRLVAQFSANHGGGGGGGGGGKSPYFITGISAHLSADQEVKYLHHLA